ncbi:serine/threonine-protein kinase [Streptomyces fulvoviolaceus]|uniref:serine/threonine-protein kinase n=1 Tax=Streptomyces fulvoviolaceus TaxID=285535 RepID=UPI000998C29B|nr:serine/threonine-protein kinase [Streptomyces fulvoviolaceus]
MVSGGEPDAVTAGGRLIGGRYRLSERLGSGGMGTVWAGLDLLVGREVAVKEALAQGPSRVERILREARAAARVNHPAVVTVHDVVMEDGHPWIVMERVHGESLADLLDREGTLPEREAASIALPVLEALAAAHARGVLHRDVKPGNVLLGSDGRVVLTDFGIAYIAGEESLTRSGEFVGSLAYTSPERMGGSRPGPASDLWSLGVLLFQMVEGFSPFQRDSVEGTVAAVLTMGTPRVRRAAALGPVVTGLLAKEPDERPTAGRVAEVLRTTVTPDRSGPAAPSTPGRPKRRWLWLGSAAGVAAALTAVLLTLDGNQTAGGGTSASPSARSTPSPTHTAAKGYTWVQEREFGLEVPAGWQRHAKNAQGQYRYTKGSYAIVVVPGRDRVTAGVGPVEYQRAVEPELQPYRDSSWATGTGIRLIEAGGKVMVEGQFTWDDKQGQSVFAHNLAIRSGKRYHVVLALGREGQREAVGRFYVRAAATYTPTDG